MRCVPPSLVSWQDKPEFEDLLHPASAFGHPREVVADPDLTTEEKRAILSSWASDACAVESNPTLRRPSGVDQAVEFDEIVDALRSLDEQPRKWKRVLWRRRSRDEQDGGLSLS